MCVCVREIICELAWTPANMALWVCMSLARAHLKTYAVMFPLILMSGHLGWEAFVWDFLPLLTVEIKATK